MSTQRDPEGTEAKYLHSFADVDNAHVLEIGSGAGRLTWLYAESAGRVTAVDPDGVDLMDILRDTPPGLASRVTCVQADAETLPFTPHTFDSAILAWSL